MNRPLHFKMGQLAKMLRRVNPHMPRLKRRPFFGMFVAACSCIGMYSLHADEAVFPGKNWDRCTPQEEAMDAEKLEEAVDYLREHSGKDGVHELLIVRRGRIVWEGDRVAKVHGVWSCTKSFTSTVLGLLIDDGKCTLDTRAAEFVPELEEYYGDVTLRHFTTMTSGYRAQGDEPQGGYTHGPSDTPFLPSPEPLFAPGTHYAYWDSAMNTFALVLARITGEPLEDLFRQRIAMPLEMDPDQWTWGDFGVHHGVVVHGGSGNQGKHVKISALQLARFGQLFLQRGQWQGRQLLSEAWVRQATTVQVPADLSWGHRESGIDGRGVYGFNWWVQATKADGSLKWPGVPAGTFAAAGHNNNRLFVIPAWEMVVVRLGLDQSDHRISDEEWAQFLHQIGQSITDLSDESR